MNIGRIFLDSDLRQGFDGLMRDARKAGIDPQAIPSDEVLVFINRKVTSFKLLTASHYLVYWRSTKRLPLDAIKNLPAAFTGRSFDFNKSIEKTLLDKCRKGKL